MIKRFKTDLFGNYELPFNILAMAEDAGGGDGGESDESGDDAPQPVTIGDILPTDMMDDKGNFPNSLKDFTSLAIPGADRENDDHKAFHSKLGSVFKSYADTKSMVGGMIKMPGEDAGKDEIDAFRQKLGVPVTPGDYDIKIPEYESSQLMFSDDTMKGFKEKAHEAGYNNKQVQMAIDFQSEMLEAQVKELDTKAAEGIATLQKEMGDKYEESFKGAEMMVQKYFPEDVHKEISLALGNNAGFVKGMMEIYNKTKEDGELLGDPGTRDTTAKALDSEINSLMTSEKYVKADKATHDKVAELIERKQKLLGTFKADVNKKD